MIWLYALLSAYVLWLFYLAVMNLKRAKDAGTISPVALWLGYPILLVGLVLDWLVNVVVFTILFLELPGGNAPLATKPFWELTKADLSAAAKAFATELVTGRLKRHAYTLGGGWRTSFSIWFAVHLLDTFDPSGKHV